MLVGNPRSGNGAWPCFIACRCPAMLVSMHLGEKVKVGCCNGCAIFEVASSGLSWFVSGRVGNFPPNDVSLL